MTDRDLKTIVSELIHSHNEQSKSKKSLEKLRNEFFKKASSALEESSLGKRIIDKPEGDLEQYVETYYPGYRIVEVLDDKVQLEEDPSFVKYSFIVDNISVTRNIIQENPTLDDKKLKQENPGFWDRISMVPDIPQDILNFIKYTEPDFDSVGWGLCWDEYVDSEDLRQLIPLDEIKEEDLTILQDYLIPGKLKYRLEVKEIDPEEIDE